MISGKLSSVTKAKKDSDGFAEISAKDEKTKMEDNLNKKNLTPAKQSKVDSEELFTRMSTPFAGERVVRMFSSTSAQIVSFYCSRCYTKQNAHCQISFPKKSSGT